MSRAPLLFMGLGALALLLSSRNAEAARRANSEWDSAAEELNYAETETVDDMPSQPPPPNFAAVLNAMLPPLAGRVAHLTGTFDEMRGAIMHRAVDFNYQGGQAGINLQYPVVYSPIAGLVTFSGGQYGTVKVQDANGFSHEFLHLQDRVVSAGQEINAGDPIGTMGGRGPNGPTQYARHVHYQLKDEAGTMIDPVLWWDAANAA